MPPQETTTDCFAVLGLPRAAALDGESIQQAYLDQSRAVHPDHGGDENAAAQVHAARETLRQTHLRLKHLLDLAGPAEARDWRTVPLDEDMMALFSELGRVMDASAKFLERKNAAGSALARALLANEEMRHRESLEELGLALEKRMAALEALLPCLDDELSRGGRDAWARLAATQARFAYLAKWRAQVRERLLALM